MAKSGTSPSTRSTERINILNIWLMLISAGLAFISPFYLFLIAYAVLGPLHYLTEISWLHDRGYYTRRKYDYVILIVIGIVYGCSLVVPTDQKQVFVNAVLFAVVISAIFVLTNNRTVRAGLIVAGALTIYFVPISFTTVISGLLLLTLIHVFLFTGAFIAAGALRSRSRSGYISLAVFIALAALLLLYQPLPGGGIADGFVVSHYDKAFGDMNIVLMRAFHLSNRGPYANDPFEFSGGAVAVMRFIAFAYLYHYLNWFSKTKIIRWHEVSRSRLAVVAVLWIAAIVLYLIDYDLGLKILFFLSALHVLLEFPLNVRTIMGIPTQLRERFSARSAVTTAAAH